MSLALLGICSCYEEEEGCLDPLADNYNLRADEACGDCCTFPDLRLQFIPRFGDTTFTTNQDYLDGAGNAFRLVRLRYYLSNTELLLENGDGLRPLSEYTFGRAVGEDTLEVEEIAALTLVQAVTGTARAVGQGPLGAEGYVGLRTTIGVGEEFADVVPGESSGTPLATQPGLLNFNDGRGFVQIRLEYSLPLPDSTVRDTVRVSTFGTQPLVLEFPQFFAPFAGQDVTVRIDADYGELFGAVDLRADSATVAGALQRQLPQIFTVAEVN